jgi:exosortase/archaeosortase family protein
MHAEIPPAIQRGEGDQPDLRLIPGVAKGYGDAENASGVSGIELFDYLFAFVAFLDWTRLRKGRTLVAYFTGIAAMFLSKALRITSFVIFGNRRFAEIVAWFHLSAVWIFFSIIVSRLPSLSYRKLVINSNSEQDRAHTRLLLDKAFYFLVGSELLKRWSFGRACIGSPAKRVEPRPEAGRWWRGLQGLQFQIVLYCPKSSLQYRCIWLRVISISSLNSGTGNLGGHE